MRCKTQGIPHFHDHQFPVESAAKDVFVALLVNLLLQHTYLCFQHCTKQEWVIVAYLYYFSGSLANPDANRNRMLGYKRRNKEDDDT